MKSLRNCLYIPFIFLLALVIIPQGMDAQRRKARQKKAADTLTADSLRPVDSLFRDSLFRDSLMADTLQADSLRADSLRKDSLPKAKDDVQKLQETPSQQEERSEERARPRPGVNNVPVSNNTSTLKSGQRLQKATLKKQNVVPLKTRLREE